MKDHSESSETSRKKLHDHTIKINTYKSIIDNPALSDNEKKESLALVSKLIKSESLCNLDINKQENKGNTGGSTLPRFPTAPDLATQTEEIFTTPPAPNRHLNTNRSDIQSQPLDRNNLAKSNIDRSNLPETNIDRNTLPESRFPDTGAGQSSKGEDNLDLEGSPSRTRDRIKNKLKKIFK